MPSSLQVCSISDPKGSTNSTGQTGVRNRRRRISFKLPATLLDPSCPIGDVLDDAVGKSRWKYQPKVFEQASSLSPESLLVNAVVEKTPDYVETQICMQTL
ncbi:hypothetical protein PHET_06097 [Paragonimus heterotremus]|uniref:Uncharacterized protein n=1 Tax=Paragonimus heterotremus TaxID=100268 RepID=A0A8J4SP73_9TREM|nr:hypothetical protein PHET_06097 [Paragonimus heterotremus]